MADQQKPQGGSLPNAGGLGGMGRGLEGDLSGPGEGAPAGAADRYPVGMGDDDRSHSGETAGSGGAGGGSGLVGEAPETGVVSGEASPDLDADADRAGGAGYDPSTVEVNRSRQQGLGFGASDIDKQREPNSADSTDR